MNILVCVKQVPDTTEIKIDPETHTLIRDNVPSILNPFDGFALEAALRLKDTEGGKVTVMTMGLPQAANVLREALSVGADEAYLISDRPLGGADTFATSYTLAIALKALEKKAGEGFDIIFCGKQAIDGDTGQVGPEMAEHLGYGQVTYATEISVQHGEVTIKKETDDGYNLMSAKLPVVISVTKTPFELRYATIKRKLAANHANIAVITAADMDIDLERCGLKGSPTKVKKTFTPSVKKKSIIIKEDDDAASGVKLVAMLSDAKIL
jgi:electron transfer flavoprotein beta subunit